MSVDEPEDQMVVNQRSDLQESNSKQNIVQATPVQESKNISTFAAVGSFVHTVKQKAKGTRNVLIIEDADFQWKPMFSMMTGKSELYINVEQTKSSDFSTEITMTQSKASVLLKNDLGETKNFKPDYVVSREHPLSCSFRKKSLIALKFGHLNIEIKSIWSIR